MKGGSTKSYSNDKCKKNENFFFKNSFEWWERKYWRILTNISSIDHWPLLDHDYVSPKKSLEFAKSSGMRNTYKIYLFLISNHRMVDQTTSTICGNNLWNLTISTGRYKHLKWGKKLYLAQNFQLTLTSLSAEYLHSIDWLLYPNTYKMVLDMHLPSFKSNGRVYHIFKNLAMEGGTKNCQCPRHCFEFFVSSVFQNIEIRKTGSKILPSSTSPNSSIEKKMFNLYKWNNLYNTMSTSKQLRWIE